MIRRKLKKHSGAASSAAGGSSDASGSSAETSSSGRVKVDVGLGLEHSARWRVIRYKVKEGAQVEIGQLLVSCAAVGHDSVMDVHAPVDGTVQRIVTLEGSEFDGALDILIQLESCPHNVVMNDVCVVCGRPAADSSSKAADIEQRRDMATVNMEDGVKMRISRDEAMRIRAETVQRLFQTKRLSLVLDLDHTLLHCTDDPRAVNIAQNAPASARLHFFELDGKTLILKLRPGLLNFLQAMKRQYFEMYVYTAGTRAYAIEVCKIIDPDRSVFGSRIISRDDTPELGSDKDLTRLFPVDDTMVLVVDDRDVWSGVANLITCEPFIYFRGMHDVNNPGWKTLTGEEGSADTAIDGDNGKGSSSEGNPPLSKSPLKEEEIDTGLARVEDILKKVHRRFFFPPKGTPPTVEDQLNGGGSDVKVLLREIKQEVLHHVTIAFDPEIAPRTNEITSERYLEILGIKAKLCGAKLAEQVDKNTTHLIATGETDLAQYGKQKGIWVVHPEWLEKSEHFWCRVREEPYSVFKVYGRRSKSRSPDPSQSTNAEGSDSSSKEDQPAPVNPLPKSTPTDESSKVKAVFSETPLVPEAGDSAPETQHTSRKVIIIEEEEEEQEEALNNSS